MTDPRHCGIAPGRIAWASLAALLFLGGGCRQSPVSDSGPTLATTTSYLEAAARDILGDSLTVVRLAEPGTCPGHFDLRPSQAAALRRCQALLRFDFQSALDARLAPAGPDRPRVAQVSLPGGVGLPASYLAACRQIADHVVALEWIARADADARLEAIAHRLDALSRETLERVRRSGLGGAAVIASARQRDFCEWLGLRVVAVFRPADTAGIGEIENAIAAGTQSQVRLVVANLPEGRRTADALGERLKAQVVVFENFPAIRDGTVAFDPMLVANVETLLKATGP